MKYKKKVLFGVEILGKKSYTICRAAKVVDPIYGERL